jgi:hypothetical protein
MMGILADLQTGGVPSNGGDYSFGNARAVWVSW